MCTIKDKIIFSKNSLNILTHLQILNNFIKFYYKSINWNKSTYFFLKDMRTYNKNKL